MTIGFNYSVLMVCILERLKLEKFIRQVREITSIGMSTVYRMPGNIRSGIFL